MAFFVFRLLPGLKLTFSGVRLDIFRQIADFSVFSYIFTVATMIMLRTDRIVLGVMVGLGGVTIYQLGTRIPEIVGFLSSQFQETLSPVAAALYRKRNFNQLHLIMFRSLKITVFLSTGVFLIFTMLAPEIMLLWLKVSDPAVLHIVYIMLLAAYLMVAIRSTPTYFLFMIGHHRLLAFVVLGESIVNLVLSIVLVKRLGVEGVAWGTVIPSLLGRSRLVISAFCPHQRTFALALFAGCLFAVISDLFAVISAAVVAKKSGTALRLDDYVIGGGDGGQWTHLFPGGLGIIYPAG